MRRNTNYRYVVKSFGQIIFKFLDLKILAEYQKKMQSQIIWTSSIKKEICIYKTSADNELSKEVIYDFQLLSSLEKYPILSVSQENKVSNTKSPDLGYFGLWSTTGLSKVLQPCLKWICKNA